MTSVRNAEELECLIPRPKRGTKQKRTMLFRFRETMLATEIQLNVQRKS